MITDTKIKHCKYCGKPFKTGTGIMSGLKKYCSPECERKAEGETSSSNTETHQPSPEEIKIKENERIREKLESIKSETKNEINSREKAIKYIEKNKNKDDFEFTYKLPLIVTIASFVPGFILILLAGVSNRESISVFGSIILAVVFAGAIAAIIGYVLLTPRLFAKKNRNNVEGLKSEIEDLNLKLDEIEKKMMDVL